MKRLMTTLMALGLMLATPVMAGSLFGPATPVVYNTMMPTSSTTFTSAICVRGYGVGFQCFTDAEVGGYDVATSPELSLAWAEAKFGMKFNANYKIRRTPLLDSNGSAVLDLNGDPIIQKRKVW